MMCVRQGIRQLPASMDSTLRACLVLMDPGDHLGELATLLDLRELFIVAIVAIGIS
jgi:hypothetical protein